MKPDVKTDVKTLEQQLAELAKEQAELDAMNPQSITAKEKRNRMFALTEQVNRLKQQKEQ